MRRLKVVLVALVLLLVAACGRMPWEPDPQPVFEQLVAGLAKADLAGVPGAEDATPELTEILRGMDGLRPTVAVQDSAVDGDTATAALDVVWSLPAGEWRYPSTARASLADGAWRIEWAPSIVHPELTAATRLVQRFDFPERGRILGAGGTVLAGPVAVFRLGLNKPTIPREPWADSARRIAQVLEINEQNYVDRVVAAGDQAFVEALVIRGSTPQDIPAGFESIPGSAEYADERTLTIDRGFAEELIGVVGPASAEDIEAGNGVIVAEQQVGKSGLQRRYDEQLRGTPGSRIVLTGRSQPTATPAPGATPTPAPEERELFRTEAVAGTDLTITLDQPTQARAEAALENVEPAASIAVVRPSTGEILALANSAGSEGRPDANFGRYAPGSTFKVVTALALIRSGLQADSTLTCNQNTTVDGRQFKNYSDFPPSRVGELTLTDAITYSCNTALIAEHDRIDADQLRSAAQSLGFGADHDAGFPVFYGEVGTPPNVVGLAESMIGQGSVLASPLAMAGVAASVEAGHTVVPHLLPDRKPASTAAPLTAEEAQQLQAMMQAVVERGTGTSLQGVAQGAKTGTAEYGTETPLRTHAWMIAYSGDVAIAAFVKDGESGSQTAGPLIESVLR